MSALPPSPSNPHPRRHAIGGRHCLRRLVIEPPSPSMEAHSKRADVGNANAVSSNPLHGGHPKPRATKRTWPGHRTPLWRPPKPQVIELPSMEAIGTKQRCWTRRPCHRTPIDGGTRNPERSRLCMAVSHRPPHRWWHPKPKPGVLINMADIRIKGRNATFCRDVTPVPRWPQPLRRHSRHRRPGWTCRCRSLCGRRR